MQLQGDLFDENIINEIEGTETAEEVTSQAETRNFIE
jgi:hypothetical protein